MAYTPEKFGQTIKAKFPQYKDIPDRELGLKMLAKYPQYKDIVVDNSGVQAFLKEKTPTQSLAKNFAKSLPGAVADVTVKSPVKLGLSAYEGLSQTIKTGGRQNYSDKTYNVPLLGQIKSFQSEAVDRAKAGQNPFLNIAQGGLGVAAAGLDTVGLLKGVTKLGGITSRFVVERKALMDVRKSVSNVLKAESLAGKIIQGKPEDIVQAKKALSTINAKDIKTYADLEAALTEKIQGLSSKLDDALESKKGVRTLTQLNKTVKAGTETLTKNSVKDALSQLDDFYAKTNNIEKQAQIKNLIQKANTKGLSIKEINDIAKLHGQELNAYNASGQLASGLSKQAAENTRQGVKSVGRELFGSKAYDAADEQLSALINTRDKVVKMKDAVNALQQKVIQRGFGQKAGRLVAQVVDKLTGGAFKGFVQSFIPRGEGLKVFNALDLEKALPKTLKMLQKASNAKSEQELITALEDIIKNPTGLTKLGETYNEVIRPAKLGASKLGSLIKVNNYQKPFPKYIPKR